MDTVFLRNEDGAEMEQPASVEDYFVARGWVVFDPAHEAALAKVESDKVKAAAKAAKAAELAAAKADAVKDTAAVGDVASTTGLISPVQ